MQGRDCTTRTYYKMKICRICKEEKPLTAFVKYTKMPDGLETRCRECNRTRIRKIRDKNPGYNSKHAKKFRLQNPEKRKAHRAIEQAIRSGAILRMPCVVCGDPKSESHHEDYSRQLDVIWFCRRHHAEHHEKLRANKI